jgi:hypothetical protein
MVMAKLHLICGNCGCSDEWIWCHVKEEFGEHETVYIKCMYCLKIHDLNDKAEKEEIQ